LKLGCRVAGLKMESWRAVRTTKPQNRAWRVCGPTDPGPH
jgi:hypothetical protein